MRKLFMYWWNTKSNIGDEASYYIVSRLFNGKIIHKKPFLTIRELARQLLKQKRIPEFREFVFPWTRVLFGVGSILDYAGKNDIVWGSGFREDSSKTACTDFRLVRGNLTRKKIGCPSVKIGDPVLALPSFYKPKKKQLKFPITIIPHYTEYQYFNNLYSSSYNVLKIESKDVETFVDSVANSEYVLSTSLHGIIIAHAYGVPVVWIKKGYIKSSDFKFYDYFSSVGVRCERPLTNIEEILKNEDSVKKTFDDFKENYQVNVDLKKIQLDILESFPVM